MYENLPRTRKEAKELGRRFTLRETPVSMGIWRRGINTSLGDTLTEEAVKLIKKHVPWLYDYILEDYREAA